jgi:hypothetical protein
MKAAHDEVQFVAEKSVVRIREQVHQQREQRRDQRNAFH